MGNIYDNLCAHAYENQTRVSKALQSLQAQASIETPNLEEVNKAVRFLDGANTIICGQLQDVGRELALALNEQQATKPIIEIPDILESKPQGLNDKSALEILSPLLATFNGLFALKVELTKQFPNKFGNPLPGPDQIKKYIEIGIESVRENVRIVLEQISQTTRGALLKAIAGKYQYGVAMVRDLTYFLNQR